MKRTTILIILLAFSITGFSQTLSVTSTEKSYEVLRANISAKGISVSDSDGTELITAFYNPPTNDPSLKVYSMNDGSFVVRENIANFLLFDSFGKIKKSISNSSQSEGGEAISELAMDDMGKTVVLYNPKVMMEGNTGSRAKIINSKNNPLDIFYSQDRALTAVEVSANGEFVAFASVKEGTDDKVELMDRFGNILNTIEFDQPVKGVSFSEVGLFVAIYSGSRAAAFEIRSGERVGSTSFRNTSLIFAGYDSVDKIIIGLTGSGNRSISEIQLHAVNVSARKIARKDVDGSLEVMGQISLKRTGSGRYLISGMDKNLTLRANF